VRVVTATNKNLEALVAARALGIHKSTLFRKIKTLRIALPPQDGRRRISDRTRETWRTGLKTNLKGVDP
jgi:transcriptional regulator with GAF, ATPase, and Fis domain